MKHALYTEPGTSVIRMGRTEDGAAIRIHGVVRRRVFRARQPLHLEVQEADGTTTTLPATSWRPVDLMLAPAPTNPVRGRP